VRHYYFTALCVALSHFAWPQSSSPFMGPRANALGYAASCLRDTWSIFNNPAGISSASHAEVCFAYDATPGFASFNRMAVACTTPLLNGYFGGGIFRFGDELYSEQFFSAGYANKFGIASLGARVQYIQFKTENFGTKGVMTFSAGGIAELTSWLTIGAQIINATQPEITENEKLPTILILGISLKASEKVIVLTEIEKNINENPLIKGGLEYQIHKKIFLRTGFTPKPLAGFFGFGIQVKKIKFDYAFSYLTGIVTKHQAGFLYQLKSRK
jgi:hypothetical protein